MIISKPFIYTTHTSFLQNLTLQGFVLFVFNGAYVNCQEKFRNATNHGYEPQSKLWKQIRKLAAGFYILNIVPLSFARGIIQLTDITALRL